MLLKSKLNDIKKVLDTDNVLATLEERYCYSKDASNFKSNTKIPDLVVFVKTIEEVQMVLKYANIHNIPVIARGAGTNMVGACNCTQGGIVINFSKMNKILDINPVNLTAKVQPGVVLGDLKTEVEKFGLFYPPDPSNYKVSTIGGSIAQSSGGAQAFKYGTTKDYILSLKVVTADGSLMKLGVDTSKNATGYNLSSLIVGSEGTLAIVVEATLKLIPLPETKSVMLAYFNSIDDAVGVVNEIITSGVFPVSIDYMDNNSMTTVNNFINSGFKTEYNCVLLIDFDGSISSVENSCRKVKDIVKGHSGVDIFLPSSKEEMELIWRARRASFAAATRLAPDVVSDDLIVPRENLANLIKTCNNVAKEQDLKICLVGHIGDGNLHPQFVLDLNNEVEYRNYMLAKSMIYKTVIELGGTISAEHGIGLEKKEYLRYVLDADAINYMKHIKRLFDPNNILNPDKIFDI